MPEILVIPSAPMESGEISMENIPPSNIGMYDFITYFIMNVFKFFKSKIYYRRCWTI